MTDYGGPPRSSTAPLKAPRPQDRPRPAVPPLLAKRNSQRDVLSSRGSFGATSRQVPGRPATSYHATHAKFLQLQEYHERLEKACASTYQIPLQPAPGSQAKEEDVGHDSSPPRRKPAYCRARILRSSRDCFVGSCHGPSPPPPAFSTPAGVKDCVLPSTSVSGYVSFHQTTPRCSEFLYTTNQESARRMRLLDTMASAANTTRITVAKDHFALGPGQYDVAPTHRPRASKFSPSDRFHEDYTSDKPGPGQYLPTETLVSPRATAAVFSQCPRETDLGSLVSPTANIVSSYYYVPETAFREMERGPLRVGWSRTSRFKSLGRHDRVLLQKPPKPNATDFVSKNVMAVQAAGEAARRQDTRRARHSRVCDALDSPTGHLSSRHRRATQATVSSAARQPVWTRGEPLQGGRRASTSRDDVVMLQQSWTTIASLASFQMKLVRFHQLTLTLQRLRSLQAHTHLRVTFTAWKTLDGNRLRQYAAQLIVRNSWRLRLWTRIHHKRRYAKLLRLFLQGLSVDVRFALSMKRIKRKVTSIQRWWRHAQLMVRAREEALYHKWIAVETRLSLEYINQLPHLQRIFTAPAGTAAAASAGGVGLASAGAPASDLQLHRLLNLPDQRHWFSGRFVLSSDGSMRGYAVDTNELIVETRQFRCHYHDVSSSSADEMGGPTDPRASYTTYTNAVWKPFLMLFRQGAFRFVLITSLSPLPAEILSWKDKLEQLMVNPTSAAFSSGGSISGPSGGGSGYFSVSTNELSFSGSVSDLVEVSMQSGILAPALTADGQGGGEGSSANSRPTKFQTRMRSVRQRTKSGMHVCEGALQYYVVDLLKDLPRIPSAIVWATIRDRLREKRKAFRAEIYRHKLELFNYEEHQEHVKHLHVVSKFRDFFVCRCSRSVAISGLRCSHVGLMRSSCI
jgi:hypothetical protein